MEWLKTFLATVMATLILLAALGRGVRWYKFVTNPSDLPQTTSIHHQPHFEQ